MTMMWEKCFRRRKGRSLKGAIAGGRQEWTAFTRQSDKILIGRRTVPSSVANRRRKLVLSPVSRSDVLLLSAQSPVAASGQHRAPHGSFQSYSDGVQAGMRILWHKAQQVPAV